MFAGDAQSWVSRSSLPLANGASLFSVSWRDNAIYAIGHDCAGTNSTTGSVSVLSSTDGGATWNSPSSIATPLQSLRQRSRDESSDSIVQSGLVGIALSGTPLLEAAGKVWLGASAAASSERCVLLLSAPQGTDPSSPASWTQTAPLCYNSSWVPPPPSGWLAPAAPALLSPNPVLLPSGTVGLLAAFQSYPEPGNHAALLELTDEGSLRFVEFVNLPGGHAPFRLLQPGTAGNGAACSGGGSGAAR